MKEAYKKISGKQREMEQRLRNIKICHMLINLKSWPFSVYKNNDIKEGIKMVVQGRWDLYGRFNFLIKKKYPESCLTTSSNKCGRPYYGQSFYTKQLEEKSDLPF